eukprot:TRINITY_DN32439_c0_g1_i1.p1 TRINITY_DN32439_c0_g1~~TRINITY_DN32439_c0_g1_i1.p1  ORF type:complete len:241 (+),score=38.75 TRINITY_DN32439_c0_g1_i1:49-771(+)
MNVTVRNTVSGEETVVGYSPDQSIADLYNEIGETLLLEPGTFDVLEEGDIIKEGQHITADTTLEVVVKRKVAARRLLTSMGQSINGAAFLRCIEDGDESKAALFIDAGVDVNAVNCLQVSAIHLAVEHESYAICKHLLSAHVNLDVYCPNGCSPLSSAVQIGNYKIAKLLIEAGSNISPKQDAFKKSLLYYAVSSCHENNAQILDLLLSVGADREELANLEQYACDDAILQIIKSSQTGK